MNMELKTAAVDYLKSLQTVGVRRIWLSNNTMEALKDWSRSAVTAGVIMKATRPQTPTSSTVQERPLKLEPAEKVAALAHLRERILSDQAYRSQFQHARNMVFGVGSSDARILFVGEAPGVDEDEQGEPFVGKAGELLTKMIQAMGLTRGDVYIANIVKYRPDMPPGSSGNRKPTRSEIEAGLPYVCEQIRIIQPAVLVALGGTAVEGLLSTAKAEISKQRGHWTEFMGIPLMPTFHPAYLLRNPSNVEKRKVWEDLLQVMEKTGLPVSEKQRRFFL